MSLVQTFDNARFHQEAFARPGGLDLQNQFWEIPMSECIKGFSADYPYADDISPLSPQPYHYGVTIEFEPGKRDEFMQSGDIRNKYHMITNTIREQMNDTLALEIVRDERALDEKGRDTLSDDDYKTVYEQISESTLGDAEIVMGDVNAILRHTFPDSGIIGTKLGRLSGENALCRPPSPEDIMKASAPALQTEPNDTPAQFSALKM